MEERTTAHLPRKVHRNGSMLAFHFHMNQQRKQRPQQNNCAQDHQLVQIVDQNGFQDLCGHFEFQTRRHALCQLKFEIGALVGDKTFQVPPESGDGRHGNYKNANQFTDGNNHRKDLGDYVFENMNHIRFMLFTLH